MTMNDPLFEAVGMALLHLLWQGALVAGVLAAALRILSRRSALARYAVSCFALASLLTLGVATSIRSYEGASPTLVIGPAASAASVDLAKSTTPVPPMRLAAAMIRLYAPEIVLVWLVGVAFLTIRLGVSWLRARRLVHLSTRPAAAEWQQVVVRIAKAFRISRPVRLLESTVVEVPAVIGWLRPAILLPASSLTGLTPEQLEMILAHELAHIRRHDFLVNILQSIAETLLFYHPATWWISRQIRIERENCCDDAAVAVCGNALQYARALTLLEELRQAPSLVVAASGGSLFSRIGRLLGRSEKGTLVPGWTALAAALSFALLITVASLPALAGKVEEPATAPVPAAPEAPPAPPEPLDDLEPIAPLPIAPALAPVADASEPSDDEGAEEDDAEDADEEEEEEEYEYEEQAVPPAPPSPPVVFARPAIRIAPRPTPAPRPITPMTPRARVRTMDVYGWDDDASGEVDSDATFDSSRKLTVDELISLRIHNVTPEYVNEMRAAGFSNLRIKDALSMRIHNVTAKYITDLRAAGVEIKTVEEAVSLKIFNVTPELVRSLAAAGYTKLTARELSRLRAAGINAEFIRDLSKYRDKK